MNENKDLACELSKSLYGLKQSLRTQVSNVSHLYIWTWIFRKKKVDHGVYSKQVGVPFVYPVLNVDDMLLIGNNKKIIKDIKY